MTVLRIMLFGLLICLAMTGTGTSQQNSPPETLVAPRSCPVTVPPASPFTPPSPYPSDPGEDSFWIGTDKLWIDVSKSGIWHSWRPYHTPGREHRTEHLTAKTFWWSADYNLQKDGGNPDLKVTGRRLDGESHPLVAMEPTNAFPSPATAMLVGVYIPTAGCWEITGEYKGQKLSFVIWVTPRDLKSGK